MTGEFCHRVTVILQRGTGRPIGRTVEEGPSLDVPTQLFRALCPQLNRMVTQLTQAEETASPTDFLPANVGNETVSFI